MATASQLLGLKRGHWRSELAFRILKEHLGLRLLWSANLDVPYQQLWACLLLSQVVKAANRDRYLPEVEPFDVSIELLVRYGPRLLERGLALIEVVLTQGRTMGTSSPRLVWFPKSPSSPLCSTHPEVVQPPPPRSAHHNCHSRSIYIRRKRARV